MALFTLFRNVALPTLLLLLISTLAACDMNETGADQTATGITAEIAVTGGAIVGTTSADGTPVWFGIPYAAPPVGALRWREPQPVVAWEGTRSATEVGAACQQLAGPDGGFYNQSYSAVSEDCLTLNVWSRATSQDDRLPVMFWIHGGGLTAGSGGDYRGDLLTKKGVVLVTINYRLGAFGFLAHPELSAESPHGTSGNQGILDQIKALEWTRNNISAFGGDPDNITIFGESAGALSVSLVQASPLAKGMFHRAIGQSGGSFQPMVHRTEATSWTPSAEARGEEFTKALLPAADDGEAEASLAALRAQDPARVLEAFQPFAAYEGLAIVDGHAIPREVAEIFAAGDQSDVPVMTGSNADEGSTLLPYLATALGAGNVGFERYLAMTLPELGDEAKVLYPVGDDEARRAWIDLFSDVLFAYPQRAWARGMANASSPAYLYYFTWSPPVPGDTDLGAFHAGELGYVFGDLTLFGAEPTEADEEFSETIADLWVRFARTGNPNGDGFPEWPAFTPESEAYMELGETIQAGSNLRIEHMNAIDRAFAVRRGAS